MEKNRGMTEYWYSLQGQLLNFSFFPFQNSIWHGLFSEYDLSVIHVSPGPEDHLLHLSTFSTLSVFPDSNDRFLSEIIRRHLTLALWNMLSTLNYLFTKEKCSWINLKHWSLSVGPSKLHSQGFTREQSADYQIEMKWLERSEIRQMENLKKCSKNLIQINLRRELGTKQIFRSYH